jgi:hypothetical protein
VTPRTITAAPTDRSMWRRLFLFVHPDTGGDEDLFVWCRSLQEHIDRIEGLPDSPTDLPTEDIIQRHQDYWRRHNSKRVRIPFEAYAGRVEDLRSRAISLVDEGSVAPKYGRLLLLLADYPPTGEDDEEIGASYKILAAIAYAAGLSKRDRKGWYRVAEKVPLSQAHARYIIGRLKERDWVA